MDNKYNALVMLIWVFEAGSEEDRKEAIVEEVARAKTATNNPDSTTEVATDSQDLDNNHSPKNSSLVQANQAKLT